MESNVIHGFKNSQKSENERNILFFYYTFHVSFPFFMITIKLTFYIYLLNNECFSNF